MTNALGMAIHQRQPAEGTVIHSDQGTQFTSWPFTRRALDSGVVPSMGSVGDCFDNAVIESFWSRMQVELLDRQKWRTPVELANAIFEYTINGDARTNAQDAMLRRMAVTGTEPRRRSTTGQMLSIEGGIDLGVRSSEEQCSESWGRTP